MRRPVILGTLILLILPTLIGIGGHLARKAELEMLRTTNVTLRQENDSYREATGALSEQIASLQTALSQLNDQAQLDPATKAAIDRLPALIRSRATGGGNTTADAPPIANVAAARSAEGTFNILHNLLDIMGERLKIVRTDVEAQKALAAAMPTLWPITGWYTSSFGMRTDPLTGDPDFHSGLDISADRGTPVRAPADGTVEMAERSGNYGNCIVVEHGFGIETRFGHLSSYAVRPGQKIKRNQVIGYVGSTGRTTGPHLHYEILLNGRPINPLRLLTRP